MRQHWCWMAYFSDTSDWCRHWQAGSSSNNNRQKINGNEERCHSCSYCQCRYQRIFAISLSFSHSPHEYILYSTLFFVAAAAVVMKYPMTNVRHTLDLHPRMQFFFAMLNARAFIWLGFGTENAWRMQIIRTPSIVAWCVLLCAATILRFVHVHGYCTYIVCILAALNSCRSQWDDSSFFFKHSRMLY